MMKTRMVLKQPPPIFFAPYPAASPRSSLLMPSLQAVACPPRECTSRTGAGRPGSERGGRGGARDGRLVGIRRGIAHRSAARHDHVGRLWLGRGGAGGTLRLHGLREPEAERVHLVAV